MNDNSIQINSYLQNEMSAEERIAFESRLSADKELRDELHAQKQVINAVMNAGLRAEFSKAVRKRAIVRKLYALAAVLIIGLALFGVYNFRDGLLSKEGSLAKIGGEVKDIKDLFVNPPIPGVNVPFSEYSFDAEKGDTLYYPSGSIIYFPPSALVDAAGNTVKGSVKVTYREFADPLDFFISGIPMGYDSAGVKYNFESSGMCEIAAYKDNKPVFVNKQAKPEINLSSKNKSPLHNLYFLDTVNRSWKYMGKDVITEVKDLGKPKSDTSSVLTVEKNIIPIKPIMPVKASDNRQSFVIEIEPGSFEELMAYDKLKFEVVNEAFRKAKNMVKDINGNIFEEGSNTELSTDAAEQWTDVKLEHTSTEGIYIVTFTNAKRKVTYKVRPVLEGGDYAAALKVFQQKNTAYEQALKNRKSREQNYSDSLTTENKRFAAKAKADYEENERLNKLILARNKEMKELYEQAVKEQKLRIEQAKKAEKERLEKWLATASKDQLDAYRSGEIIRSFQVNNFGVWNCDHPAFPNDEVPLASGFTDSLNNKIVFQNVSVVYKGFNGITQFPSTQIRIMPQKENMIWAIKDASFYYFSYEDFAEANIQRGTGSFNFKMRKAGKPIRTYEEIRDMVGAISRFKVSSPPKV